MWKYVKKYLHFAILAAVFMVGEVMMDLVQPGLMSQIVDEGVLGINHQGVGNPDIILKIGLMMIGLVIFGGLCGSLNNAFVHMTGQNIGNEIRKDCFKNIMSFSFEQMDHFSTGSLVTRVTNDITQVQTFVSQFVRGMIRTSMLMFGSIFFMYQLNHQFGYIVLGAFPFICGCMIFCLYKANPLLTQLQQELDQVNSIMQEDISGIRIIKACVREIYEKIRFGKANRLLVKTQLRVLVIFAFMNPIMNALMYIVVVIILIIGHYQVGNNITTPGTIMAAITYTTQLLNGILMLVMLFQNISKGLASWKRLQEILNSEAELKDGQHDYNTTIHGKIEFRDVSFSFPNSDHPVLKNINFIVNPGETVAIMGATGSGKTALVHLIPRFYDVSSGHIFIDDIDVKDYQKAALREKIALALQKSELFTVSIQENIAWGNPQANFEQIRFASCIGQAEEFIQETPNQYDTLVAERGMSLSGGQKQRISIARAVLKATEILIFDDATSALDLKTEAKLYEALSKEKPEITKIIIAQRIASVCQADKIIILNNGTIEACGNHAELMKISPTYQEIYHSQIGNEGENYE